MSKIEPEVLEFQTELKSFKVKYPGDDEVLLGNHECLFKFAEPYLSEWKEGNIVSVPHVRNPRIFLREGNSKESNSLIRGEKGEAEVYKKLLNLNPVEADKNNGLLVFPNLNGDTKFKSKMGKIEIDCIIVHARQGVFIINIKNSTRISIKELCDDMTKHRKAIEVLNNFSTLDSKTLPINGVVCSLAADIQKKTLEAKGFFSSGNAEGKQHFFKPGKDSKSFEANMREIIKSSRSLTENQQSCLEVLACRLIAINSMDASIACFHKKMISNTFQSKAKKRAKFNQSESQKPPILWTKEQLKAISEFREKIAKSFAKTESNGMRLRIHGPSGSGKTELLYHFASVFKSMFKSKNTEPQSLDPKILVCDGRQGQSMYLLDHFCKCLPAGGVEVLGGCSRKHKLESADLVLVDEFLCFLGDRIIRQIKPHQHCVIFLSDNCLSLFDKVGEAEEYDHVSLTKSLRSSLGIARFVEAFRSNFESQNIEFGAFKSKIGQIASSFGHNLEGSRPDVEIVPSSDPEKDPFQLMYVEMAVKKISEAVKKSTGLESILVVLYLHSITIRRITDSLEHHKLDYEYPNPIDIYSSRKQTNACAQDDEFKQPQSEQKKKQPKILLTTDQHLNGTEFGSVIVLLERSLPQSWNEFVSDKLFISFTRATIDLKIVINDSNLAPYLDKKQSPVSLKPDSALPSEVFNPSFDHRAYESVKMRNQTDSDISQKIVTILEKCFFHLNAPVVLIGNVSAYIDQLGLSAASSETLSEIDFPEKTREKFKWFVFRDVKNKIGVLDDPSTYRLAIQLSVKFSALILVAKTEEDYFRIQKAIAYYILLYQMYEKKLHNSPIYFLTCFKTTEGATEINRICQFLTEWKNGEHEDPKKNPNSSITKKRNGTLKRVECGRIETPAYRLRDSVEYLTEKFSLMSEQESSSRCEQDHIMCEKKETLMKLVEQTFELSLLFKEASKSDENKKCFFLEEAEKYRTQSSQWEKQLEQQL